MSITTAGRGLTNDMVTEVSASQLSPILLASLSFATPVHIWTGYGTITVGSTAYLGIGTLGSISPVEELSTASNRVGKDLHRLKQRRQPWQMSKTRSSSLNRAVSFRNSGSFHGMA